MAQNARYTVSNDSETGSKVLKGLITRADLDQELSFTWLAKGYDAYTPDARYTDDLKARLNTCAMVLFMGTWCDDSHYWVPKFFKLLDAIGYPEDKLTIYGVDRTKTTGSGDDSLYHVRFVPSIIVMKDGKEKGRITESAQNGLEADLKQILDKQ
jgi:hypothetical protein